MKTYVATFAYLMILKFKVQASRYKFHDAKPSAMPHNAKSDGAKSDSTEFNNASLKEDALQVPLRPVHKHPV
jgi:hypothetical protein